MPGLHHPVNPEFGRWQNWKNYPNFDADYFHSYLRSCYSRICYNIFEQIGDNQKEMGVFSSFNSPRSRSTFDVSSGNSSSGLLYSQRKFELEAAKKRKGLEKNESFFKVFQ